LKYEIYYDFKVENVVAYISSYKIVLYGIVLFLLLPVCLNLN